MDNFEQSPLLIDCFGFQWHITNRCDQKCIHCYGEDFSSEKDPEIQTLIDISDLIFKSLAPGSVTVNVTGGEPLLYSDIFPFLNHLSSFSNLQELNLITNALDLSDLTIESLVGAGLSSVKVSFESHLPKVNDSIRGSGHFEKVQQNIMRLKQAGLPVILMVTLGDWNFDSVSGLIDFAARRNIDAVIFERYVPLGRGNKLAGGVLSATQWTAVINAIIEETGVGNSVQELLPFRAFRVDTLNWEDGGKERLSGAFCNLGPESMALMPDGTVFPCRRLPIAIGTLPTQNIKEIISALGQFSPQKIARKMEKSRCGSCVIENCAGCRALSLALSRSLYADDPQCAGK
ncbi:radical SAM domain protein [Chitinispirillum alkaliphilum]|nr:radical SAM domain protein [Chitinispirillum alkaliphilum]